MDACCTATHSRHTFSSFGLLCDKIKMHFSKSALSVTAVNVPVSYAFYVVFLGNHSVGTIRDQTHEG